MTNAVFDASIACWEAKRHWDYVRPVEGDLRGREMGRLIGAQSWEKAQAHITGQVA